MHGVKSVLSEGKQIHWIVNVLCMTFEGLSRLAGDGSEDRSIQHEVSVLLIDNNEECNAVQIGI